MRIEGAREFRISEGATRVHVSVVLRLLTDVDGLEGNAEVVSAPPGKPEEFLEEIVGAIERYVAPALVGMPVRERGRAVQAVARALKGRVWTKAAVTNALYDLHAKAIGVPIADLLGGRLLQRVPVIGPVVGIMTPDAMAKEAATQSAAGFLAIKIKVGETVEADIDRVAAVRAAIGESMSLRVDANDHYVAADAIRLVRAIERYRPEHIEQPVARHDMLGLAEVRRNVGVPIMTDDMVATPEDAMNVIRLGAADRMKVKVTKHGFDGARAICAMLSSAGLTPVLGHVFEMGLAAIAEAQFAACTPGLAMPCEIGSMAPMGTHADIVTNDLASRSRDTWPFRPASVSAPTWIGSASDAAPDAPHDVARRNRGGRVVRPVRALWIATALGLPYMGDYAPGSGFLPLWLGVCLLVLSAIHVVSCLRAPAAAAAGRHWRKVVAVTLGLSFAWR